MTRKLLTLLVLAALLGFRADAQNTATRSSDGVWDRIDERAIPRTGERAVQPRASSTYRLDKPSLDEVLQRAPREFSLESGVATVLTLPMPDGGYARFRIEESPLLSPELAAQFPDIRTYRAQGIDDPTATARLDWNANGFHAIVFGQTGTVYVDPYMKGDTSYYVSYFKRDLARQRSGFQCLVDDSLPSAGRADIRTLPLNNGTILRTYRLAVGATAEYTAAVGGTPAAALAAITTSLNRVNGIYERDLAVRMTLVSGTNVIFTNAATDGYTNDDGSTMLDENQAKLDSVIGSGAYDIGHVFSTGGGGVASLRSVCSTTRKAMGVTGLPTPTGDGFDVDYVAHEIGHQFGGNHSFNSISSGCGGNRVSAQAYEPGSGVTIMGYTGICSPENLAAHSIDNFNVGSLDEITSFLAGSGGACATTAATGNTAPTVSAGSSFTIPRSTPFALTATASDANSDSLTYSWEQFDLGSSTSGVAGATTDNGQPLFRPYSPASSATRTFPSLTYILNNANVPPSTYTGGLCTGLSNCLTAETLPTTSRTMTFAVVARDNRASGGGIRSSTMTVTVASGAGPFTVTSPNTAVTFAGNSTQTVTWSVANTTAAPVSTPNVRILLSTDGGSTFGTTLASSTANDGSESVTIPNTATTTARIKVEGVSNIFFDVSDANFTITQSSTGTGGSGGSGGSSGSTGSTGSSLTGIVDFLPRALDLNGDGRGDLFSYNQTTGAWRWDLENGALRPSDSIVRTLVASTASSWDGGWTVKSGDFNNDGRSDVFLYSATTGRWFKAINNGANNFTYYTELTSAGYQIAIGNFGGSALDDVFFYNATSGAWSKCVSTGSGSAGFACDSGSWDPGWQVHPVETSGDTVTDLFLYNPTSGVRLHAYPAAAGFTYANSGAWSAGWGITPGAYDRTAGNDFVLYNSTTGQWFIIGGGSLNTVGSGVWSPGWTVKAGDLNGDGLTDVFLYDSASGTWFECFNNGAGDWTYASGRWDGGWQISMTSFNGDARADLLLYNSATGTFVQCINTGSAAFTYHAGSIGTGMTVLASRP